MWDGRPHEYKIDLGDGFIAKTRNKETLEKHGVLGQGSLHYVNTLSALVDEQKAVLPAEEWESLEWSLRRFMIDYEGGDLYYYLMHTHGADALSYNTWAHFSLDTVWSVCLRTFTDMPTAVIEEYGVRHWKRRSKTIGEDGYKSLLKAISNRTDIYGNGSMPPNMARDILFHDSLAEYY